ncbi:hypothetical protein EDC04DRAFT_131527 [Pisolithus marmoratus]|nr:hypothetical protein EDC04DRAFT_131527 [Pisolithus marmoratus]
MALRGSPKRIRAPLRPLQMLPKKKSEYTTSVSNGKRTSVVDGPSPPPAADAWQCSNSTSRHAACIWLSSDAPGKCLITSACEVLRYHHSGSKQCRSPCCNCAACFSSDWHDFLATCAVRMHGIVKSALRDPGAWAVYRHKESYLGILRPH